MAPHLLPRASCTALVGCRPPPRALRPRHRLAPRLELPLRVLRLAGGEQLGNLGDGHPARAFPSSISEHDQNRRDIGTSQAIWTDSKMRKRPAHDGSGSGSGVGDRVAAGCCDVFAPIEAPWLVNGGHGALRHHNDVVAAGAPPPSSAASSCGVRDGGGGGSGDLFDDPGGGGRGLAGSGGSDVASAAAPSGGGGGSGNVGKVASGGGGGSPSTAPTPPPRQPVRGVSILNFVARTGIIIEAPWLVNGGHGASLMRDIGKSQSISITMDRLQDGNARSPCSMLALGGDGGRSAGSRGGGGGIRMGGGGPAPPASLPGSGGSPARPGGGGMPSRAAAGKGGKLVISSVGGVSSETS
jgi:hypothetical protein